jgi:hypothetical protein
MRVTPIHFANIKESSCGVEDPDEAWHGSLVASTFTIEPPVLSQVKEGWLQTLNHEINFIYITTTTIVS